jgi:hypothetical protein
MTRLRSRRGLAGTLAALTVPILAAVAHGASVSTYRGRTSQHLPISFTISGGRLGKLQFSINDRCPNGDVWRVHHFGFHSIKVSHSRFSQRYTSTDPRATVEIKGRIRRRKATGTLVDRTLIEREHQFCQGTATFSARR